MSAHAMTVADAIRLGLDADGCQPEGAQVAEAYRRGELDNEVCLYVIAALLHRLNQPSRRLISAAPQLLVELDSCVSLLDVVADDLEERMDESGTAQALRVRAENASRALAKARGGS